MNYLESKTMDNILKDFNEVSEIVSNLQYRLENSLDPKVNSKKAMEASIKILDDLHMNKLHGIREWLFALENNKTK